MAVGIGANLGVGADDMVGVHHEIHIRGAVALHHRCHQERLVWGIGFLMHVLLQYQQVGSHLGAALHEKVVRKSVGTNQTALLQRLGYLLAIVVEIVACDDVGFNAAVTQAIQTFQHIVAMNILHCVPPYRIVRVGIGRIEHTDVAKGDIGGNEVECAEVSIWDSLKTFHSRIKAIPCRMYVFKD